jgi:hypothetical protein
MNCPHCNKPLDKVCFHVIDDDMTVFYYDNPSETYVWGYHINKPLFKINRLLHIHSVEQVEKLALLQ